MWVEDEETTAIMQVGSVRGKERFETPRLRVEQGGRGVGVEGVVEGREAGEGDVDEGVREAKSVGGQVRLKPAFMERVGWPHCAQKGLRAFQSRRARAWA